MGCEESYLDMNSAEKKSPSVQNSDYTVTKVFLQENQVQVEDSEPSPLTSMADQKRYFRILHADAVHNIKQRKSSKQCRILSTSIMKTLIVFHRNTSSSIITNSCGKHAKKISLFLFNVNCVLVLYCYSTMKGTLCWSEAPFTPKAL